VIFGEFTILRTSVGVAILEKTALLIVSTLAFYLGATTAAGAIQLVTPSEPVLQGEVVLISVLAPTTGSTVKGFWRGASLDFFKIDEGEYGSLVGIDLKLKPGTYPLKIQVNPEENSPLTVSTTLEVVAKDYGVQRLTLPENMVTLDPETLARVRKEGARFSQLWHKQSPRRHWSGRFLRPVPGKLTTPFGLSRILNGEPRNPHSGIDLRAAMGEPVKSANHGRIVLVGEFYFHGKAVVIDHGWGLYTMYFHLCQVNVSEGDFVEKKTTIGLAGSSGRATGPHLHWGVRLGGARVDPLSLLKATGE
jgi:hypothetical protein